MRTIDTTASRRVTMRVARSAVAALAVLITACEDQTAPVAPRPTAVSAERVPATGPDGGAILFSAELSGVSTADQQLYSVRPDGTGLRIIPTDAFGHDQFPVWSPDFRAIAFSTESEFNGEEIRNVHVINADATVRANFGPGSRPRWSPDGRRLAFSRVDPSSATNGDLYIGSGKGRVTQLTFTPEDESNATWSPDGKRIAFVRFTGEESEIYVMDADGRSPARKLTNCEQEGARCSLPSWSVIPGDERILVFVAKTNPELRLIRADGGPSSTLLADPFLREGAPSWSPDGSSVAFISARDAADPTTQSDVYTINVATKIVQRVTSVGPAGHSVHSTGWSR